MRDGINNCMPSSGIISGNSGQSSINYSTVTFTSMYFTKSSTDLYVTLAGGTDVPAESEYDKTAGMSRVVLQFATYDSRGLSNAAVPAGAGRHAAQHRINTFDISTRLDGVTWNSSRTELTVPLGFDLIKNASQAQWHTYTDYFGYVERSRIDDYTDRTRVHADVWADDVGEQIFEIDRLMPGARQSVEQGASNFQYQYSVSFMEDDNSTAAGRWYDTDSNIIPLNGPSGTSVFDANGFSLSNIADVSSSASATGDPHITTFGGDRYTL